MMQAESSGMRPAPGLCPGKLLHLECSADFFKKRARAVSNGEWLTEASKDGERQKCAGRGSPNMN